MIEQTISLKHEFLPPQTPEEDYERNMGIIKNAVGEFRNLHAAENTDPNDEITHDVDSIRLVSPQTGVMLVLDKRDEEYHPVYEVVVNHESLVGDRVIAYSGRGRRELQSSVVTDVVKMAQLMTLIGRVNIGTILAQSGRKP